MAPEKTVVSLSKKPSVEKITRPIHNFSDKLAYIPRLFNIISNLPQRAAPLSFSLQMRANRCHRPRKKDGETHEPAPHPRYERWMCSGETVRQLIRTGKLPAFRIGRMMRVTPQALEEYE